MQKSLFLLLLGIWGMTTDGRNLLTQPHASGRANRGGSLQRQSSLLGASGQNGALGSQGKPGSQRKGAIGPSGQGLVGQPGGTGRTGKSGPQPISASRSLIQGEIGRQGDVGEMGATGPTGPTGIGMTGATGITGVTGQSIKGPTGFPGNNSLAQSMSFQEYRLYVDITGANYTMGPVHMVYLQGPTPESSQRSVIVSYLGEVTVIPTEGSADIAFEFYMEINPANYDTTVLSCLFRLNNKDLTSATTFSLPTCASSTIYPTIIIPSVNVTYSFVYYIAVIEGNALVHD